MADALHGQHESLNQQWHAMRLVLKQIAENKCTELDEVAVNSFIEGYRAHIHFEETEIYPMAKRLLTEDAIAKMGFSMRLRRNL